MAAEFLASDSAVPEENAAEEPVVVVDDEDFDGEEEDQGAWEELLTWLTGKVEILPSKLKRYTAQFVKAGVGSIKRLAKKIKKTPDFLESLEIAIDDSDEINEVLSREGVFEAIRLEKLASQKAEEAENEPLGAMNAPSSLATITTRTRAPSMAPAIVEVVPDAVAHRSRQGTMVSESEVPAYLNNPYAYTYINDQPDDDIQSGASGRPRRHTQYASRKLSDAKLDVLAAEVAEVMHALKSSVDEQDDMGVCEAFEYIAAVVENSVDKQRAFQRAFAHLGLLTAMNALIGNTEVCERACRCIALFCRCSDDKGTTNYEFCKAFGLSGACETIVLAVKKHADNAALVQSACDAIRSMCQLESNKQRFHDAGASDVVAGAISNPNFTADPQLCAWICRTIGHLAQSNASNQDTLGENLVAPNLIIALQGHQKNDQVCTEVFWAIRNLAIHHEQNRSRFREAFGPESINVAFARHVQVEVLAIEATTALVSLINDERDEIINRIANSGAMTFVVRAMRKSPDCESLAYRALQLLYFCAAYENPSYPIKRKLTSNDFLECISTALENHAGDCGVAEWGCRLLHELVEPDSNTQARMRNAGLCEMVVSAVQRQAISDGICALGCAVIGDLALDAQNHDRLAAAGACEAACGALRRHDDNNDVVMQACYAIHYLSFTQNNVGWIGANGGCEAVAQALVKHTPSNLVVTQFAARALGSLAFKDEGNMVRIFEAGGCAAVVVALRTHPKDREISEYCCRAIYHLCGDNANVSDLGAKGACGLVVQALVTHMNVWETAAQACLAVSGLAVKTRSDKEHKGNTRKLVQRGAVENVVLCIKTYPDEPAAVRAGAMAITSLSRIDANRKKVGETGVSDLLIKGLTTHSDHADCVAKVAQAIEMLSQPIKEEGGVDNEDNKDKFCKAGVQEVLVALLRKHERHAEVVVEVLRALITLATHPLARKDIWSDEACKLYVKVMKLHEKEEDVARWACNMIYNQAVDNAARVRLGVSKACEGVVAVLAKHAATSPLVVRYACRAMCGLAELDANRRKFNTTEACSSVVTALKVHFEDADVAEWACFAIVSISPNQGNRHKFFQSGACPLINKVLQKHMESEIVTTLAFEAIRELSYFVDNRLQLGAIGTNETIARALEMHLDSHEVATHACRAIAGIAFQHAGNAAKLGAVGVCELLLRGLRLHWPVPSFIEWSLAAISVLSEKQRKNQDTFSEGNIASLLVGALLHHSSSAGVCYQGAKAVRCLTFGNEDLKRKMALAGISPVVLSCLQGHQASGLVTENSCWVLGNILCFEGIDDVARIAADNDLETTTAAEAGPSIPAPFSQLTSTTSPPSSPTSSSSGPGSPRRSNAAPSKLKPSASFYSNTGNWETLVSALQRHMFRPQTVRWVCAAIATFADRSRTEHSRCCEAVMQALALHADALSVSNKVLVCLGALAHSHVKNASRLGKLKACEEVASILMRSEEEPAVHGCFAAIAGLANCSAANQGRFSASPTLGKDIVTKLYDMLERPLVARWGCACISALCWKNHENQSKLGKASNFIADIIEQHFKVRAIVRDAVRAAACLAHNHITNRNRLGANGCCEWVPKVMANPAFSSDGSVMVWAVRVVADLAANNPNNQTKLGSHGACEALVRSISQPWASIGEDEAMAKYALWAIGNMVQLSKDTGMVMDESKMGLSIVMSATPPAKNTTRLSEAGVVQAVLALMAKYESSAVVVRWACRAINNLAKSQKIRAQLNHLRVRWVLEAVSKRYAHDKAMVEWSSLAQDTLINGNSPPPTTTARTRSDSGNAPGGSPRTSFSAVADKLSLSLGMLADSATDTLMGSGSAEKVRLSMKSDSLSPPSFLPLSLPPSLPPSRTIILTPAPTPAPTLSVRRAASLSAVARWSRTRRRRSRRPTRPRRPSGPRPQPRPPPAPPRPRPSPRCRLPRPVAPSTSPSPPPRPPSAPPRPCPWTRPRRACRCLTRPPPTRPQRPWAAPRTRSAAAAIRLW